MGTVFLLLGILIHFHFKVTYLVTDAASEPVPLPWNPLSAVSHEPGKQFTIETPEPLWDRNPQTV